MLGLAGFAALAAAMGIGRFVYTPILPVMVEALGLSKAEAGLIASANFLGYLAGALMAAWARVPGSRRTWMIGALVASALTTGAMALGGSLAFFLVARFLGGAASAFVLVFASSLVLDRLAAAGRPALSSVHFAGVGGGIAIAAVLVSTSLALGGDWRELWLANAAAALAAAVVVARLLPKQPDPPRPAGAGGDRPRRGLVALVVAYGLFGFGYVITATFLVAIVRDSPALAPLEPVVWLLVGLSAVPSVALWGALGRRLGVMPAFGIAVLVEAAGVATSVLWTSPAGILVAALLLGGTFMGITALGLVGARRMAVGDPSRVVAVMTAAFGLGQIVGPSFAGLMFDRTGSFLLPSIAAALALALSGLLVARVELPPP
jgi:predicted MFS family arabinose efflux permease